MRWIPWPTVAYAAAGWAFLFASISFYWGAGGMGGVHTLAHSIQDMAAARDTAMIAGTWATGVLKALAGMIALAMARPWGTMIPRRLLLVGGWSAGVIMTLYGAASIIEKLLMEFAIIDVPTSFGTDVVRWYLLFWDPFWLIGGLLFLATTQAFTLRTNAGYG